ncbi:aldo/keto reductase [Accumulibacter sp.]|uniref:aldo/keto reductase n=1 Tax=Accumulibacter sp. TaxID=2053492 RepID=UPI0025EF2A7B|nr:aldo/keto reductase [Accumulibacter sp.]MCM8612123.1 aldo/keto reductase [Accumulibacter sp.]MCM8635789.1 aldo/keto reductase [Accumulibacter sp.]MCM8639574.1 aldo/keto reductase [Accumulibacter sp.]
MKYRQLGRTRLEVSAIALGCSGYWGDRTFPEKQAAAVVVEAVENGINFFDTGHNYSGFNAEPRLGRLLGTVLKHDRARLVVSSKAGTIVPAGSLFRRPGGRVKDFSPDHIEWSCAQSIANLRCGYLDILQLHGITPAEISEPLLERLDAMRVRGMYRYLGINTHSEPDMSFVASHPGLFDMTLIDYNVAQLDREPVIRRLAEAGTGVVAGTVLGQGHLVKGKIGRLRSPADLWYLARAWLRPSGRQLWKLSASLRETLAAIREMSPAQAAIAYVLANCGIASCVVGTTRAANLREIVAAVDKTLSDESLQAIRRSFGLP